jgi:two-component system LytT family response regulator
MKLRTLIVDDELFSRNKIRAFLADYPEFEVVGECETGEQAAAAILKQKPDVVFLDIEIPGQNGLELLGSLPTNVQPAVILVTAFDKYAVQAFEIQALDYLLKPVSKARFAKAISRFHEQRNTTSDNSERKQEFKAAFREIQKENRDFGRIVVKCGIRLVFLQTRSIEWIEAEGDYVKLHVGKDTHLLRETMTAIAKRLDAGCFARIHRSTIVNLDYVRDLRPLWAGDYVVFMRDGTQLTLSRKYRPFVQARF